MTGPLAIINKSTVPIGTGDWVADIVRGAQPRPIEFSVVSCPEFLREGSAIADFMSPHRTVIGSLHREAAEKVAQLHLPLRAPIVITDLRTAEMIKYASNAFLATKISFMNELADLCECVGADVKEVAAGMGYDARIGRHFLDAGLGWGGSCFPKDVKALAYMAKENGLHPRILDAVTDVNYSRRSEAVRRLEQMVGGLKGKTIGVFGLAFKPNTDDMREAPSIDIVEHLIKAGARVHGYDPVAMNVARPLLPAVEMFKDPYEMARGCDAVMIVTEWNEFKQLDLDQLKEMLNAPILFDGRNIYDPKLMREEGFIYQSMGRANGG
jgi:UDPglucose 6-dehydrogenase